MKCIRLEFIQCFNIIFMKRLKCQHTKLKITSNNIVFVLYFFFFCRYKFRAYLLENDSWSRCHKAVTFVSIIGAWHIHRLNHILLKTILNHSITYINSCWDLFVRMRLHSISNHMKILYSIIINVEDCLN